MSEVTSYVPFARKYRPQNFASLLGQEALVKTLSFAIEKQHLPSSILLSGIRGVGKTSSARIVAKTILCENPTIQDNLIINCNKCNNCLAVSSASHPDIMEIDAASHTGVDDAREIIQSAEYMPVLGSHKIFIIDEVHMLSRSAFNALLKTLEEPPQHVLFIFATTEVQKLPATIISRCQRFDLKRLSFDKLTKLLTQITTAEKITAQQPALNLIALKSEGSAREAVSMLDQLASYAFSQHSSRAEITIDDVNAMLGLVSNEVIFKLVAAIINKDAGVVVDVTTEIYQSHNNLELLMQDIADLIAEITKFKLIDSYSSPIISSYLDRITGISKNLELSQLTILWQITNSAIGELKKASNQLICCQMGLIKAMHFCAMPAMEQLVGPAQVPAEAPAPKNLAATGGVPSVKKKPESVELQAADSSKKLCSFLGFCQKQNELGLVFCILNESEIVSFEGNKLILKGSITPAMKEQILELLSLWVASDDASIELIRTNDFTPIKQGFEAVATQSPMLAKLKGLFPNAKVADILLADI